MARDGSDRIVTIPGTSKQLDPNGAGALLFAGMQDDIKRSKDIAQLDVTEGIRSKYRMEEARQGNQFAESLTKLRSVLQGQQTDVAYQRQQEATKQASAHLEGMIGSAANQGISMPNMTTNVGEAPEAGYPGVATANPIAPGALELANTQFGRAMDSHFKAAEARTGMKMDVEKKVLYDQLDLIDQDTATEAKDMYNRYKALGADPRLLAQMESFTQAGKGRKSEWHDFRQKTMPKEMELATQARYKMEIAKEISARTLQNTKLKQEIARALANTKMDATQFKNLTALHQRVGAEVAQNTKRIQELMEAALMADNPAKAQEYQALAAQLRADSAEKQEYQSTIADRMAKWTPANPGTPPAQAGPTLGQGFDTLNPPKKDTGKDPMGIR